MVLVYIQNVTDMLRNMLPRFFVNYGFYCAHFYSKFRCDFLKWNFIFSHFSYLINIGIIQYGKRVFFSYFPSSFRNAISGVIYWFSQKKMSWFYAGRIVAFMTNKVSFWYFSIMEFPGKSSSRYTFVFCNTKNWISFYSSPYPTIFFFFYMFPKTIFGRLVGVITTSVCRIGLHRKFLSCVMPLAASTAQGLFTEWSLA